MEVVLGRRDATALLRQSMRQHANYLRDQHLHPAEGEGIRVCKELGRMRPTSWLISDLLCARASCVFAARECVRVRGLLLLQLHQHRSCD